jgi:GTP-binding protein
LLDASSEDPVADYHTVRRELELHDERLATRPEIIAFNKIDLPDARAHAELLAGEFGEREVLAISGATGEGVQDLVNRLLRLLQEIEQEQEQAAASGPARLPVIKPQPRDRLDVVLEDDVFVVNSRRAEEEALRLGETGYEGLDELQQRLRRMGLERAMRRAGGRPGDLVRVGDVEFEWHG